MLEFPVKPEARPYLDAFTEAAGEPQWLRDLRRRNLNRFAETGFPSRKSESWRYLDLHPLETPLLPMVSGSCPLAPEELDLDFVSVQSRLVNGICQPIVRRSPLPEGVWIAPMQRAVGERGDLVRALAVGGDGAQNPFGSLNAACFSDGLMVDLAPRVALDRPIGIVHFASTQGSSHTRSLINLGEGSRATLVEIYGGDERYWRNDVVTARLGPGAQLTRIVVVEEAAEAIHTTLFDATLSSGARLASFALLLGGSRVRQEWNVRLTGEGARCRLDAAYIVAGNDEANIVAAVDHAAPGGETRELIKGVAADRGHGAFQGRIIVREHAQKTDAHQLSRNLLIGRRAVIDTKPELEILADDVKCSHGASVGDLDAAALFYLRARGIPPEEARHMLIDGFLREAVEQVDAGATRDYLLRRLAARLDYPEKP